MRARRNGAKPGVVLQALMFLLVSAVGIAQKTEPVRYPLSEALVARSLQRNGIHVEPSQVHLPMSLSAESASPELEIAAAERLGESRIRLELRCRRAAECLPFNATLDVQDPGAIAASASVKSSPAPYAADRFKGGSLGRIESLSVTDVRDSDPSRLTAGSQALLVIEDGHMVIHLPVIAMDSGAVGARIRVCTPDRKKVFRATVVDETTVKGLVE